FSNILRPPNTGMVPSRADHASSKNSRRQRKLHEISSQFKCLSDRQMPLSIASPSAPRLKIELETVPHRVYQSSGDDGVDRRYGGEAHD
ncbi:hypothetical protein ACCT09_16495, partial [Rhizobium ruizarguesonis]